MHARFTRIIATMVLGGGDWASSPCSRRRHALAMGDRERSHGDRQLSILPAAINADRSPRDRSAHRHRRGPDGSVKIRLARSSG